MSPKLKNLNADNFYQHLRQASRLLKSALNREALDKLKPWNEFLDYVTKITGTHAGTIAIRSLNLELIDPVTATWPEEAIAAFIEGGLGQDDFHQTWLNTIHKKPSQVLTINEATPIQKYKKTAFYNEFAKLYEVDSAVAIAFPLDASRMGKLVLNLPSNQYEMDPLIRRFLCELAEDIGMALSYRGLLKKLVSTQGTLNRFQMGVVILDERALVSTLNAKAEEILKIGDPLVLKGSRLETTDDAMTQQLQELCHSLIRGETRQREHELILKSSSSKTPIQVIAATLNQELSESIFGGYVPAALFLNRPNGHGKFKTDLKKIFQEFYGCTDKQAQVAALFAQGFGESEIAEKLGMAKNTARVHLAEISRKIKSSEDDPTRRKTAIFDIAQQHQMPLRTDRELIKK